MDALTFTVLAQQQPRAALKYVGAASNVDGMVWCIACMVEAKFHHDPSELKRWRPTARDARCNVCSCRTTQLKDPVTGVWMWTLSR